jgi:hypothetical protein
VPPHNCKNLAEILAVLFFESNDSKKVWTTAEVWSMLKENGYDRSFVYLAEVLSRLCKRHSLDLDHYFPAVLERFDRGKYKVRQKFLDANKEVYAPAKAHR